MGFRKYFFSICGYSNPRLNFLQLCLLLPKDSVATNASETSRSLQIYQGWLSSPQQTVMSSVCIALSHHLQINMAISDTSSCSHRSFIGHFTQLGSRKNVIAKCFL